MSNQWEELIKEVRKTESEVELKLVSFSKLGSSYALSIQPQEQNSLGTSDSSTIFQISHSMSVEIEQLLANVRHSNFLKNSVDQFLHTIYQVCRIEYTVGKDSQHFWQPNFYQYRAFSSVKSP